MAYSRYAICGAMPMTAETAIVVLLLVGILIALGAQAFRISAWWLLGGGSLAAAVVVLVAAAELSTPCSSTLGDGSGGLAALFVVSLILSLVLYAGAAVAGVIDGLRSVKEGRQGRAVALFVLCPLASVVAGAIVLYAAIGAAFHCFELN
jgi:hypothetical protein